MIISRCLTTTQRFSRLLNNQLKQQNVQQVRNSGAWRYRQGADSSDKLSVVGSEVLGGFMWWWILWHLFTEPEHLYGEFPYPDPSQWSNSELGIPSDDEP